MKGKTFRENKKQHSAIIISNFYTIWSTRYIFFPTVLFCTGCHSNTHERFRNYFYARCHFWHNLGSFRTIRWWHEPPSYPSLLFNTKKYKVWCMFKDIFNFLFLQLNYNNSYTALLWKLLFLVFKQEQFKIK